MIRENSKEVIYLQENVPIDRAIIDLHSEKEQEELQKKGILRKISGAWIFDFVGILTIENAVLVLVPKIFNRKNIKRNLSLTVEVLKTYGKTLDYLAEGIDFFNQNDRKVFHNEIELAEHIIKDYLRYGLWQKRETYSGVNSPGEVNWEATVDNLTPIFSGEGPIYYRTYNDKKHLQEEDLITRVHKWAIAYCHDKYGKLLGYGFLPPINKIIAIEDIGALSMIKYHIKRQLSKVYSDREIRLFKNLLALLDLKIGSEQKTIQLFGTRAFHQVWEKACISYFGNDYSKIKGLMPHPEWHIKNKFTYKSAALIPDIVLVPPDDNYSYIFDAKYYNIKFDFKQEDIAGHPGIGDLIKQYYYADIISRLTNRDTVNTFLFPSDEVSETLEIGRVDFFNHRNEDGIHLLLLPFVEVLQNYVKGSVVKGNKRLNVFGSILIMS